MTKAGLTALVAAAFAAVLLAGCGGGRTGAGKGYDFTLPAHWQQRSSAPKGLLAVYVRAHRTALLTIRSDPGDIVISKRFINALDARFQRSLKGYEPLSHRILVTKAGPAFYFSFTQKRGGRLTTILLVPAHGKSYVLDAVSNPTSKAATHDIATIFHTFVPR